jgi:hypothetical protein
MGWLAKLGSGGFHVIIRVLDRLEERLIAALIAAATLVNFFAVGHRYGTGLSIDIARWAAALRSSTAIRFWGKADMPTGKRAKKVKA